VVTKKEKHIDVRKEETPDEFELLLSVPKACEKLSVVCDNMCDFRDIIMSQEKTHSKKKR